MTIISNIIFLMFLFLLFILCYIALFYSFSKIFENIEGKKYHLERFKNDPQRFSETIDPIHLKNEECDAKNQKECSISPGYTTTNFEYGFYSESLDCKVCKELGAKCLHFTKTANINVNDTEVSIGVSEPGKGLCMTWDSTIKAPTCTEYLGKWVLINLGAKGTYAWVCKCLYPWLRDQKTMFDDCTDDSGACNGHGKLKNLNVDPMLTECECDGGYIGKIHSDLGPFCAPLNLFEADNIPFPEEVPLIDISDPMVSPKVREKFKNPKAKIPDIRKWSFQLDRYLTDEEINSFRHFPRAILVDFITMPMETYGLNSDPDKLFFPKGDEFFDHVLPFFTRRELIYLTDSSELPDEYSKFAAMNVLPSIYKLSVGSRQVTNFDDGHFYAELRQSGPETWDVFKARILDEWRKAISHNIAIKEDVDVKSIMFWVYPQILQNNAQFDWNDGGNCYLPADLPFNVSGTHRYFPGQFWLRKCNVLAQSGDGLPASQTNEGSRKNGYSKADFLNSYHCLDTYGNTTVAENYSIYNYNNRGNTGTQTNSPFLTTLNDSSAENTEWISPILGDAWATSTRYRHPTNFNNFGW